MLTTRRGPHLVTSSAPGRPAGPAQEIAALKMPAVRATVSQQLLSRNEMRCAARRSAQLPGARTLTCSGALCPPPLRRRQSVQCVCQCNDSSMSKFHQSPGVGHVFVFECSVLPCIPIVLHIPHSLESRIVCGSLERQGLKRQGFVL